MPVGVTAEVFDVPFSWVCEIALVGEEKDGVIVICAERCIVEFPEETTGGVDEERDVKVFGCGGWAGWQGIIRFSGGKIVVSAGSGIGYVPGSACG
ncbi:hypothetical protein NHQ30_010584 [Ciborinia camelliae]|nr:hypothetical protein NHQ30_010584 [Ciborinia camelliae]